MIVLFALIVLLCVIFALGLIIGHSVVLRWAILLWAVPTIIVVFPALWFYFSVLMGQLASESMADSQAFLAAQLGGAGFWLVLSISMVGLAGICAGHRMANAEEAAA